MQRGQRCRDGLDDKDGIRMKGVTIFVWCGGGGRIRRGDEDETKIERKGGGGEKETWSETLRWSR